MTNDTPALKIKAEKITKVVERVQKMMLKDVTPESPVITGNEVTCTDASRVVVPDAEIEPTDDDARTAARELSYFVPRDAEVERRVTPNGIPMLFVDCTTKGETVRRIARITRDHALDVARERLAASVRPRTDLLAEANAATREMMREGKERQREADFEAWKNIQYLRGYAERPPAPVPQGSAPRAMPPDIAGHIREARATAEMLRLAREREHDPVTLCSNSGFEADATDIEAVCDALEAAYAPRDESAGLPLTERAFTDDEAWGAWYKMRDVFEAWQAERGPSENDARKYIASLYRASCARLLGYADSRAGLLSDPRERYIIEDALDKWIEGDKIPDFAERDLRAKLLGQPKAGES